MGERGNWAQTSLYHEQFKVSLEPLILKDMLKPNANGPHTARAITAISKSDQKQGEWDTAWEVLRDSPIFVDEEKQLIYFQANRDTPLETHLYVASYAPNATSTEVVRLTPLHSTHSGMLENNILSLLTFV